MTTTSKHLKAMTLADAPPTQAQHPMRAIIRTLVAVLAALPTILLDSGLNSYALGAQVIAISGAITALLANPFIDQILAASPATSWLAAQPYSSE